jgi:hypothetical protein
MKHSRIVGGQYNGNSVPQETWKWMVFNANLPALELAGERAGSQVASGTDFERNLSFREQIHQCGIIDCGNSVTDAFYAEEFDGFADFIGAANFASVHEPV